MVDRDGGQLYTMEGIAAALIMLVTAWIVLSTTTMYTPGDTHISDMQLEQLGTDTLAMMDTPNSTMDHRNATSDLQKFVKNNYNSTTNPAGNDQTGQKLFNAMFLSYADATTGKTIDHLQYSAMVYYRNATTPTGSYSFGQSRNLTPGDHAVRVTRWVLVDDSNGLSRTPAGQDILDHRNQEVLLEVLLWRG